MVLRQTRVALALATLFMVAGASCMRGTPTQRLAQATPIAVAFVHDKGGELAPVPPGLVEGVNKSLLERNLVSSEVQASGFAADFVRKRASKDRLESIASLAGDAPLMLLVETRAEYYSQLSGRYRWTVYVKLSLAKVGEPGLATIASFDVPVMLSFDHQREQDALAYAAGPVARKLGQELDDFLAGLNLETQEVKAVSNTTKGKLGPIYFVMLDRFANGVAANDESIDLSDGQAFHGGDLQGLIAKLDYIKDLGFETLWLAPIFAMRTEKIAEHGAFHGYWTEDLAQLEPRFGSARELQLLREGLAERGMTLVLDMVLNHVGYETKLVTEKPNWFHGLGNVEDWDDPVQLTTHDVHGLPDLDQDNPLVYRYLLDASVHWIETLAPAGFRLDAVKHVGSDFWRRYTKEIRAQSGDDFATIGELFNGNPSAIAAGFEEGGFSHLFDFPLYFAMTDVFCKGQHAGRLAATLSLDRLYSDPSRLVTFADNHDLPRVFSACGENEARVSALLSFMLTARGLPAFNYGTEAGLSGQGEPQNRADMKFEKSPRFAALVSELLRLRREHPVFEMGVDTPLVVDATHYAYARRYRDEAALVLVNTSEAPWRYEPALSLSGARDALSGQALEGLVVEVMPASVRILLLPATAIQQPKKALRKLVVHASAQSGELYLVGGGPELGSWQPDKAPRGIKLEDGRFRFELMLPASSVLAFKLVRSVEGKPEWEQRDNRYLVVKDTLNNAPTLEFESP